MKKLIALIIIITALSNQEINAQENGSSYKTAIGVKFYPGGLTIKHFIKENAALEGILYLWDRGTRVTGLYEFHGDIKNAPGLKWYIGPGAHVGFYNDKHYNGGTSIGVDGVLGLDYKFKGAPINMSVDWQPSFEFGDYAGFGSGFGGIAVRYAF